MDYAGGGGGGGNDDDEGGLRDVIYEFLRR
jgi:hypothetical protein